MTVQQILVAMGSDGIRYGLGLVAMSLRFGGKMSELVARCLNKTSDICLVFGGE